MPKRRTDADHRRFLDEFASVRVSRFRASGVIDPAKRQAVIPFPNGKQKLIAVAHTHLKYGGGWSYFICPKCAALAQTLYSINDKPRCGDAAPQSASRTAPMGHRRANVCEGSALDRLIAKLETQQAAQAQRSACELGRQVPARLPQPSR